MKNAHPKKKPAIRRHAAKPTPVEASPSMAGAEVATQEKAESTCAAVDPVVASVADEAHSPDITISDRSKNMELTFNRDTADRKTYHTVYSAPNMRGSIRLPRSLFAGGEVPDTLTVSSPVPFAEPHKPYAQMTKEERAAARKNTPKPTLEQQIARQERALAKLRAKQAQANVEQTAAV